MITTATQLMQQLLQDHSDRTGWHVPDTLQQYLADMLAERIDRVDIIPEPSFGERYLQLYQQHSVAVYKDYADSALFFVSLMPNYGHRRGLDMTYYGSLGISTYYTLGDLAHDARYTELGNWFYHLQQFLTTVLHDQQLKATWFDRSRKAPL